MAADAPNWVIDFVPVDATHYDALRRWLSSPHMREWWGDPDIEFGYIRDMVEGRDTTKPFIIVVGGEPKGYIQYWYIGHHQTEEWAKDNPWLMELPTDTIGVDLSIGDPDLLSQGLGSHALLKFVRRLWDEGHRNIIIDPDPENLRAVRAYTKAGFHPVPHLQGRTEGVLIMQYDPDRTT